MWNCQIKFCSCESFQLIVNTKFLQLYLIFFHCQYQIATAKDDLNLYASPHHLRNTKNQNQPFHKTLDILLKLLIKKVDAAAVVAASTVAASTATAATTATTTTTTAAAAAAAAAATGLAIDTNVKNDIPTNIQSPPRVAQFNPRGSFQEVRNYTTITGGTPGKGRSITPKNKGAAYKEHH